MSAPRPILSDEALAEMVKGRSPHHRASIYAALLYGGRVTSNSIRRAEGLGPAIEVNEPLPIPPPPPGAFYECNCGCSECSGGAPHGHHGHDPATRPGDAALPVLVVSYSRDWKGFWA